MAEKVSKRDQIRQNIFQARKFKTKKLQILGTDVEIRQPSVGTILDAQQEDDQKKSLVYIMVNYCYVPGTNERVFEDADQEAIMELPVGEWFTELSGAIAELTNIKIGVEDATKN